MCPMNCNLTIFEAIQNEQVIYIYIHFPNLGTCQLELGNPTRRPDWGIALQAGQFCSVIRVAMTKLTLTTLR